MNLKNPTSDAQVVLVVSGLKSNLSEDEVKRRYQERLPDFRSVSGLLQKFYSYNEASGEWAGIYVWDSEEALEAYFASDLCKSIATAYELVAPPQFQKFTIVDVLRR